MHRAGGKGWEHFTVGGRLWGGKMCLKTGKHTGPIIFAKPLLWTDAVPGILHVVSHFTSNYSMRHVALYVRILKHWKVKWLAQSYTVIRGPEILTQASPGEQLTLDSSLGNWERLPGLSYYPTRWPAVARSLDKVSEALQARPKSLDFILGIWEITEGTKPRKIWSI